MTRNQLPTFASVDAFTRSRCLTIKEPSVRLSPPKHAARPAEIQARKCLTPKRPQDAPGRQNGYKKPRPGSKRAAVRHPVNGAAIKVLVPASFLTASSSDAIQQEVNKIASVEFNNYGDSSNRRPQEFPQKWRSRKEWSERAQH